ncbi:MAG: hypothetical protein M9936_30585 [Caldilinea sp.]|nr:hypothetical protein [Caldilinea sp.]
MTLHSFPLLRLLHLADSALPIGSTAHSYGLETLIHDADLTVDQLDGCFAHILAEAGAVEAAYCRRAYALGAVRSGPDADGEAARWQTWQAINRALSARKPARESRQASATLGRLLRLALSLEDDATLRQALDAGSAIDLHHAPVFGLLGGHWRLGEEATVLAFLQQMMTGLVSACQRLMPLGQQRAQSILWGLQPALAATAQRVAATENVDPPAFTPLLDIAGMRHPTLPVRLFVS